MPKTVPLPNGQTMAFPDEMPWEEIAAKLNAMAPSDPVSAPKKIPAGAAPPGAPPGLPTELPTPLAPGRQSVNRLGAELQTGFGGTPPPPPGMRGAPDPNALPPLPKNATPGQTRAHANARVGRLVRNNLPALTAAAASALGPAGIVGGTAAAALGGLIGSEADTVADAVEAAVPGGAPGKIRGSVGEDVGKLGMDTASQAAQEVGGRAVMAPLRWGAGKVYQGLIKPGMPMQREFDIRQVVHQLLEDAIPLTYAGADRAGRNVADASQAADRLHHAADAAGARRIHAGPINEALEPIIDEAGRLARMGRPDATPALRARQQAISEGIEGVEHYGNRVGYAGVAPSLPGGPTGLRTVPGAPMNRLANEGASLAETQPLKRDAQNMADLAWRQQELGTKNIDLNDRAEMAIAQVTRELIETHAEQVGVTGIGAANRLTQLRAVAETAVRNAIARSSNNLALAGPKDILAAAGGGSAKALGASTPAALGLAGIMRLLMTPSSGSMAAIGAHHVGGLPIPQSASRLLLGLMDEPDDQPSETREERRRRRAGQR